MNINEKLATACRMEGKALETERTYSNWVTQYCAFVRALPDASSLGSEEKVSRFLSSIALKVAKRTQDNALCGLVWFYASVLKRPLGKIPGWKPAKRLPTLPVWLTRSELEAMLSQMRGETLLMAMIGAGSGLRRSEILRLRTKDIDFAVGVIHVRFGKGGKSRIVCLPNRARPLLIEQVQRAHRTWLDDRQRNRPGVELPESLDRKCPAWAEEFAWFWLFFARGESRDPRSGIVRRHHIDPSTYQKAVKVAAARARINKCMKTHVCRHTFATEYLNGGGNLKELKELLGHADIRMTEIYVHCTADFAAHITSPIDREPSNVLPFSAPVPLVDQLQEAAHGRSA